MNEESKETQKETKKINIFKKRDNSVSVDQITIQVEQNKPSKMNIFQEVAIREAETKSNLMSVKIPEEETALFKLEKAENAKPLQKLSSQRKSLFVNQFPI